MNDCDCAVNPACCSQEQTTLPLWGFKHFKIIAGKKIPIISTKLIWKDILGTWKARWGIKRMKYIIPPGLYGIGNPDNSSPILVSANYKMSFDRLRQSCEGLDAWILVLDTNGINVWCAAGKKIFGTDELVSRIHETNLAEIVSHKKLILPQLGAPGVAAHEVKKETGFQVKYGPVRAKDLLHFLSQGMKADKVMRKVTFPFIDRLILTPVALVVGSKYAIGFSILIFLLSGLDRTGLLFTKMIAQGWIPAALTYSAFVTGGVLTPILLPYIPGRAFAWKGFLMQTLVFILLFGFIPALSLITLLEKGALFLMMVSISSFFAMNFTGASTFTSLTGVKKEMKYAVPLQIGSILIGFILWIISRFM